MRIIVERGETLPVRKMKTFTPYNHQQQGPLPTTMNLSVYKGDSSIAKKNTLLGTLYLTDIPQVVYCSDGIAMPQVDVTVDIDVTGQMSVTLKERSTGKTDSITATVEVKKIPVPTPVQQQLDVYKVLIFITCCLLMIAVIVIIELLLTR